MKKSHLYFLLAVSSIVCSCSDDGETPSYNQTDFIGKWQMTATTSQEYNPGNCTTYKRYYEFSESEFTDSNECDGSKSSFSIGYSFNGKNTISYTFILEARLVIVQLTETTLKLDEYVNGSKYGTSTFTRVE